MKDLTWKDAIIKVLQEEQRPLHYTEIAQLIAERGYRKSLGATPKDSVTAFFSIDSNKNGSNSMFLRVDKGIYGLRDSIYVENNTSKSSTLSFSTVERIQVIKAFGIYWNRDLVHWKSSPNLYGAQLEGALDVNFKTQVGIYLLHDGRETIYVGQAIQQPLGVRLKQHTTDRLSGRWDRFSWFGFYPVDEDGNLNSEVSNLELSFQDLGDLLEAILIESIEPRQNRRQGNQFSGIEYLQTEDGEITKRKKEQIIRDLLSK